MASGGTGGAEPPPAMDTHNDYRNRGSHYRAPFTDWLANCSSSKLDDNDIVAMLPTLLVAFIFCDLG